uniref:Major facilitator superfamily (MFS) profile domain-containing protein n=1 Tax=Timema bartmani TaxID=61472 RepID=A0A7R9F0M6_9NEOP|nr:unnamed protein product [Timema bartmani]
MFEEVAVPPLHSYWLEALPEKLMTEVGVNIEVQKLAEKSKRQRQTNLLSVHHQKDHLVVNSINNDNYGRGKQNSWKQVRAVSGFNEIGYGKFHYILLFVCGFVSTSEEMDVISMSFILPSAQCDLHLNTQTKGWLNSIIFIGMMAGAYLWGSVADSLGRKKVLIAISIMNALCIVASSFSQTYELFMFFRFLNGAAGEGPDPPLANKK